MVGINVQAQKFVKFEKLNYHNFDSVRIDISIENDSIYNCKLNYYVLSKTRLDIKHSTWAIYRGYKKNTNFWLGTSSLAVASGFYIAAAWSDPIIYIESHNKYNREYYKKAVTKRNVKIISGAVFTGLALYFYSRLRHKKKIRWILGPDGVKYTF